MKKQPTKQKFTAFIKVTYDLVVPLDGGTFEDAIASARLLKPQDIMEPSLNDVETNDYSIEIQGVHTS